MATTMEVDRASKVRHARVVAHPLLSFVGRHDELTALDAALVDAQQGRGGLWLLAGEPGMGKSRLSEEVARRAVAAGFTSVWGRCWEAGGAPAFWPWLHVLRSLVRERGKDVFRDSLRPYLVQLLPELAGEGTGAPSLAPADAGRFELLDAILSALCEASMSEPIVIVLDDLHAADQSSLALLDLASRQLQSSRILVLGTYRTRDARTSEHAALLSRLAQDAQTVVLRPLGPDEVAAYLSDAMASTPSDDLATALHHRTEGNPLFMVELVRLLASTPAMGAQAALQAHLPLGLEHTLRAHIAGLPADSRAVLEMAAIIGRELSADAIADHFAVEDAVIRKALGEGVQLGVLLALGAGWYRFSHILMRDQLEHDMAVDVRHERHRQLADSLCRRRDGVPPWSEIAHHYVAAGVDSRQQAIDALVRAGDAAVERLAFEDGASAYQQGLALLSAKDDVRRRGELLIGLCRAQVRAGNRAEGRASCRAAVVLARELGDAELLSRAALELGAVLVFAEVDPELVALLREALEVLPGGDSSLRALVQARLAAAMQPAPTPEEPIALAREAIDMARRIGDPSTLLATLRTGCSAMVDLASPELRIDLDREHARLAAAAGERHDALRAQTRLIFDCFELGDRLGADAAVRAASALVQEIAHPSVAWRLPTMEAMRLLWDGALAGALQACDRAGALGTNSGDPNARTTNLYQRLRVLRMLGRDGELLQGADAMMDLLRGTPMAEQFLSITAASCKLVAGERDAALRMVNGDMIDAVLRLGDRTVLEAVAELALASSDRELARELQRRLVGVEHQLVAGGVIGMSWDGPVHRLLGISAWVLDDIETAASHYRRGIDLALLLGGEPVATWMRVELGELELALGRRDEARAEWSTAVGTGQSLGMASVVKRARASLSSLDSAGAGSGQVAARPAANYHAVDASVGVAIADFSIEREGEVWSVRRSGRAFRIKDGKGMHFVALLVGSPRREFHVLDLATPPEERGVADGDAGEVLDETARNAYRERINVLRDELERAEAWNDPARAEAARDELEILTAEIARGFGLGGRARRSSSNAERARINVQRRIRDAIRRIGAHDEGLARHLERAIRTGMFCSYDPE